MGGLVGWWISIHLYPCTDRSSRTTHNSCPPRSSTSGGICTRRTTPPALSTPSTVQYPPPRPNHLPTHPPTHPPLHTGILMVLIFFLCRIAALPFQAWMVVRHLLPLKEASHTIVAVQVGKREPTHPPIDLPICFLYPPTHPPYPTPMLLQLCVMITVLDCYWLGSHSLHPPTHPPTHPPQCFCSFVMIAVLNCCWFGQMARGLRKLLRKKKEGGGGGGNGGKKKGL